MAQLDPQMHKTDQLDTLDTHLQTKIDSTDLSPDSKTSYTSGEITQPVSGLCTAASFSLFGVNLIVFNLLWEKKYYFYPWRSDPE